MPFYTNIIITKYVILIYFIILTGLVLTLFNNRDPGQTSYGTVDSLYKHLYLLFTNWVQGAYKEIQAQGFSYSPSLRGLFGKPRACISWYGTSTQLVNSLLDDPF